jgi:hypothetical protein
MAHADTKLTVSSIHLNHCYGSFWNVEVLASNGVTYAYDPTKQHSDDMSIAQARHLASRIRAEGTITLRYWLPADLFKEAA